MRLLRRTFTLRAIFGFTACIGVILGYACGPVARQRSIAKLVAKSGGRVVYDHNLESGIVDPHASDSDQPYRFQSTFEDWTDAVLGPDYLHHVVYVSFDNAFATDEALIGLGSLDRLQGLIAAQSCCNQTIGSVAVTDRGLQGISRLKNLVMLDLSNACITDNGVIHLSRLTNLRNLSLAYTAIGDCGIKNLTGLHQLESLVLTGTQITDDGLRTIATLPKLQSVCVVNTNVTAAECSRIQKERPTLWVVYEPLITFN